MTTRSGGCPTAAPPCSSCRPSCASRCPTSGTSAASAAAAFLDGADVTETWGELDATRLHWAAGGGLRLPTPVGAVRFDVGFRLNRTGAGEPRAGDARAYHLSVGEAF